jgi:hypothetical protein
MYLKYLDICDPGSFLELVLVEQFHSLERVHGFDEADVLGELKPS